MKLIFYCPKQILYIIYFMLPYQFVVRIGFLFQVVEIAFNANKLCAFA